jgi:thioredoxin
MSPMKGRRVSRVVWLGASGGWVPGRGLRLGGVGGSSHPFGRGVWASVPVVVDYWAAWCGPCRMISRVLEDLAKRHAGHVKVVKVDVDANAVLAAEAGAQSIPLLVVTRGGQERDRIVGALPPACPRAAASADPSQLTSRLLPLSRMCLALAHCGTPLSLTSQTCNRARVGHVALRGA